MAHHVVTPRRSRWTTAWRLAGGGGVAAIVSAVVSGHLSVDGGTPLILLVVGLAALDRVLNYRARMAIITARGTPAEMRSKAEALRAIGDGSDGPSG